MGADRVTFEVATLEHARELAAIMRASDAEVLASGAGRVKGPREALRHRNARSARLPR